MFWRRKDRGWLVFCTKRRREGKKILLPTRYAFVPKYKVPKKHNFLRSNPKGCCSPPKIKTTRRKKKRLRRHPERQEREKDNTTNGLSRKSNSDVLGDDACEDMGKKEQQLRFQKKRGARGTLYTSFENESGGLYGKKEKPGVQPSLSEKGRSYTDR